MHIAFLNPQGNFDPDDSYWTEHPDFGGQLVYVKEVTIELAKAGNYVDILTRRIIDPDWPEFANKFDQYPGVENLRIVRIPCGPDKFLPKESLWQYLGAEWVQNIQKHYKQEEEQPDIFTAHYGDGGLAGVLLSKQTGIPFTFTGHSLGAQKMDKMGVNEENYEKMLENYQFQYRIIAERLSMNYASRIFTSTHQEKIEQYGHPVYKGAIDPSNDARFSVTPPGVNLSIFNPEHLPGDDQIKERIDRALENQITSSRRNLPIVLAASRLDKKKNHLGVIKAFAENPELKHAANFAIVVRGLDNPLKDYNDLSQPEKAVMDEIVSEIENYKLWDAVFAFSLNSQDELAAAYRTLSQRQSCFILTALYEPFGLAPLEAMSCGLPAVVTENGGPSESLKEGNQEFGVLVDPTSPGEVAKGILRVITLESNWKYFSSAGMRRVKEKYTWGRTSAGYLNEFLDILGGKDTARKDLDIPNYLIKYKESNPEPKKILYQLYFKQ